MADPHSEASGTEPSSITYDKNGDAVTFAGPDAVELFRVATLKTSISLWVKTKMIPTRGVTITKMLAMATRYTGQRYTPQKAADAVRDLGVWIATMKSALPVIEEGA